MINASNIFVKYGDRVLLDKVNLIIGQQDKVGLVGRNGAGKSTLLKIIATTVTPDAGDVTRPRESSLGFLHQEMDLPKGRTVMEETMTAFEEVGRVEQRIEALTVELEERTDYESQAYTNLLTELSDLNDRFQMLGGASIEADVERVLTGLGFKLSDMNRLTDEFSGGWQMRIELAKILLQRPDYLLLDEPTNHLDIESIIWLEDFLKTYKGAIIVISHDREFLDNVTKRTVEVELGKLYDYKAPYSKYVALRAERRALQQSAYSNQQRVIAQKERTINRFMAKATKTKMAQSMKKQLDKMERIELDQEDVGTMNIKFPPAPRSGQVVLEAKNLKKEYGTIKVLDGVSLKVDRADRLAFVGQNGQGKTTLAKILVNELSATDGKLDLGHNVQIGYYAQNQAESLQSGLTLLETMEQASPPEMTTRLRNILGAFMFSGEDADKKVSVLSGGERARLALACLLLRPFNLLVLDEPTNHLDMLSKEVLKHALQDYDGSLIVVSHDRDFLKGLTNRVVEFRDRQLHQYIGDINTFLEKRAIDNMRTLERKDSPTKMINGGAKPLSQEDRQAKKKWQRAVQYAERKVEKLEEEIAEIEKKMAEASFYESVDASKVLEKYQAKKKELDKVMEEWEEAQVSLEKFD